MESDERMIQIGNNKQSTSLSYIYVYFDPDMEMVIRKMYKDRETLLMMSEGQIIPFVTFTI